MRIRIRKLQPDMPIDFGGEKCGCGACKDMAERAYQDRIDEEAERLIKKFVDSLSKETQKPQSDTRAEGLIVRDFTDLESMTRWLESYPEDCIKGGGGFYDFDGKFVLRGFVIEEKVEPKVAEVKPEPKWDMVHVEEYAVGGTRFRVTTEKLDKGKT